MDWSHACICGHLATFGEAPFRWECPICSREWRLWKSTAEDGTPHLVAELIDGCTHDWVEFADYSFPNVRSWLCLKCGEERTEHIET